MGVTRRESSGWLRTPFAIVASVTAFLFLPASSGASPGDLDPGFGRGGVVTTSYDSLGSANQSGRVKVEIAGTLPNGSVVTSSNASFISCIRTNCTNFSGAHVLTAYTPDGELDLSFGGPGTVVTQGVAGVTSSVVGDQIVSATLDGPAPGVTLSQVSATGAAVPSYGSGGAASIPLPASIYHGLDLEMAPAPGGGVIVGVIGSEDPYDRDLRMLLTRILPDGTQDPTFGTGGWHQDPIVPFQRLRQLEVDSSGRILASTDILLSTSIVRRYDADGSPDLSFGDAGAIGVGPTNELRSAFEVGPSGDFFLARESGAGVSVTHFLEGGAPEASYGDAGATTPTNRIGSSVLALDSGGRLLVQSGASTLGRYLPDGTLDASFGVKGWARVFLSGSFAGSDIALSGSSLALAYGSEERALATVARYRLDDAPPDDLDADGVVDRRDRCPGVYGPKAGCPIFRGSVKLSAKSEKLAGSLTSRDKRCVPAGTKVSLYRLTRDKPRRIETSSTRKGQRGKNPFAFEVPSSGGRYFAGVRSRTNKEAGTCTFKPSKTLQIP